MKLKVVNQWISGGATVWSRIASNWHIRAQTTIFYSTRSIGYLVKAWSTLPVANPITIRWTRCTHRTCQCRSGTISNHSSTPLRHSTKTRAPAISWVETSAPTPRNSNTYMISLSSHSTHSNTWLSVPATYKNSRQLRHQICPLEMSCNKYWKTLRIFSDRLKIRNSLFERAQTVLSWGRLATPKSQIKQIFKTTAITQWINPKYNQIKAI